jgi:hypothetical protein
LPWYDPTPDTERILVQPDVMPGALSTFFTAIGNPQPFADSAGKLLWYFGVPRHCLYCAVKRIYPQRMSGSFPFEITTITTQMP